MKYLSFEDYMQEQHIKQNPTILDDEIADDFCDWMESLAVDEWLAYGDAYAKAVK